MVDFSLGERRAFFCGSVVPLTILQGLDQICFLQNSLFLRPFKGLAWL
jgi:hypothetical protein